MIKSLLVCLLFLAQIPFPGPGRAPAGGGSSGPPATNRTLWLDINDNNSLFGTVGSPWGSQGRTDGQSTPGVKDTASPTVIGVVSGGCLFEATGINNLGSLDCAAATDGYGVVDPDDTSAKTIADLMSASDLAFLMAVTVTSNCRAGTVGNGWADASGILTDASAWMGLYCRNSGGQNYLGYSNYDSNYDTAEIAISLNTRYIFVARHTGGNIYVSINNGSETSAASGNVGSTASTMNFLRGYTVSGVVQFPGLVGEVLTYSAGAFPTDAYNYLAGKW